MITGGASGIGRAMATALAREGARVVVADMHESGARQTARRIAEQGGAAVALRADVTIAAEIAAALQLARTRFGRLDIVCNNAGISEDWGSLFDDDGDHWQRVIAVNLTAVISGTRLAVRELRGSGGGVVVNTASMGGLLPMASAPVYAASKAGVVNFTRSLAYLKQEANVRVNALCPSYVDTPLLDSLDPPAKQKITEQMGGLLSPDLVAEGLLELVRDETRAGAIMRIITARGIDYARELGG